MKAAGIEAVEIRSGESVYAKRVRQSAIMASTGSPQIEPGSDRERYTGENRWVYQELRDRKVALFLDKVPEGFWEIRYEARAEIPGQFHAFPVVAHAMYVPEIRVNSAEIQINITEDRN